MVNISDLSATLFQWPLTCSLLQVVKAWTNDKRLIWIKRRRKNLLHYFFSNDEIPNKKEIKSDGKVWKFMVNIKSYSNKVTNRSRKKLPNSCPERCPTRKHNQEQWEQKSLTEMDIVKLSKTSNRNSRRKTWTIV